jgi:UDP-N-acetylmuramoyl-tripeptide--D-alanyl-D-alanine ligase
MTHRTLSWAAQATNGALHGADGSFARVSTDTRTIGAGELFVALSGPNFDGHEFAARAIDAGAAGLLVARRLALDAPQVVVEDTRLALGRLGAAWRAQLRGPLLAITGSNGKTTTKQMLASIMARRGPCLATRGNLNNDIGVPLTLLELEPTHASAVVELGANHRGEIAYLASLAQPDVGLITNAASAHLEGFGNLDGVAAGKGELYEALPAHGVAVINADDHYAEYWRRLAGTRRVISFGRSAGADFREVGGHAGPLQVVTPYGPLSIELPLPGDHNRMNALGAMAAAAAAGATAEQVVSGLEKFEVPGGRLARVAGRRGATLVDDSYNANPASMRAALEWACGVGQTVLFVMGDMGELGGDAATLHAEVGARAKALGVTRLFAIGQLTPHAVAAFGAGASHHPDLAGLCAALEDALAPGCIVLIKGSRSARMERVVDALRLAPRATGSGGH